MNLNFNNQALINISKNKPTFNDKYFIVSRNEFLNEDNPHKTCNCRKSNRPLHSNCLISNVVYKIEAESKGRNKK